MAGALKFCEQIEQQQNAAESGFGSEELLVRREKALVHSG
jgi:hypothetical protein